MGMKVATRSARQDQAEALIQAAIARPATDADKRASKTGIVASVVAILRLLAEREVPLGVNPIARELALPPSSCFKILKSLQAAGFVDCDKDAKGYSIGGGAIAIARRALDPSRAFQSIRPRLEETARAYSIAIGFWRMLPEDRMVLAGFVEGTNQMRIHMSIGSRLPMFIGAVGRAVAARLALPDGELKRHFADMRWQVPMTFDAYLDQVEQARRDGYGYDAGNFSPGVNTVAVAICDETGAVRYGLSGIMFQGQHDQVTIRRIAADLVELSQWAGLRLTDWRSPGAACKTGVRTMLHQGQG